MALEQQVYDDTFEASADLSTKQYYGVKLGAAASKGGGVKCSLGAATSDVGLGVLQNKPGSGQEARVRLLGLSKAVVDGLSVPIAIGDFLGLSANGRLVKVATDKRTYFAQAREAATTDAAVITVEIIRPGFYAV